MDSLAAFLFYAVGRWILIAPSGVTILVQNIRLSTPKILLRFIRLRLPLPLLLHGCKAFGFWVPLPAVSVLSQLAKKIAQIITAIRLRCFSVLAYTKGKTKLGTASSTGSIGRSLRPTSC